MTVSVVALTPLDTHPAVALVAETFGKQLQPFLPYGQPRAGAYLAAVLAAPANLTGYSLYGAKTGTGELVGFAEFRTSSPVTALLSYICVSRDWRGQGLARSLIIQHLRRFPEVATIELDVFSTNANARRFYDNLGFEAVSSNHWWMRKLPESDETDDTVARESLSLIDWPVALASLSTYGFCMLNVNWRGEELRLGVPSATHVRVPRPHHLADSELLKSVGALLPGLEAAFVVAAEEGDLTPLEHVLDSHRLAAPAVRLRQR